LKVLVQPLQRVHPPLPTPVQIADVKWRECGGDYCVTPSEAKKIIGNKIKLGKWIGQAKAVIKYYRDTDS
jgi:hypothetical protein